MNKAIKVLIVDNSILIKKVLKEILQEAGFTNLIEASNGREALEKYHAEKPDLILLDIIMPEVDGIAVVKEIGQEANVIMVSAIGQENVIKKATDYGAKGYLVKPFDKDKMLETIERVMA